MNETKKLSGPAKDRFFKRFFTEAGGLDDATAERLTDQSSRVFSSVQVRKSAARLLVDSAQTEIDKSNATATGPAPRKARKQEPAAPDAALGSLQAPPPPTEAKTPVPASPLADPVPQPASDTSTPDPFAFGLIPVFKREGAEGLAAKLATIATAEHLRAMAKAQQIVLARELRTGDIDVTTLRIAILEAVEKRIADRRAV